jgi:hypothetical protein
LTAGNNRTMRGEQPCQCDAGWGGINCNVCQTDDACNALMPDNEGGVCYQRGDVVKQNHQMCDVTNAKIVELLEEKKPQATFTCNKEDETCSFQCLCSIHSEGIILTCTSLGG